jgi:hypothetical protein
MLRTSRHPIDVFEWLMASLLVVVGFLIITSPAALGQSQMRLVLTFFSPNIFAAFCIVVGLSRLVFLTLMPINLLRLVGAISSAFLWGEMVFSFAYLYAGGADTLPPGFFMLSWQFLGEVWIAARVTK